MHRPGPGHRGRRRAALSTPSDAPPSSGVVGRERELATLRAFLRDDDVHGTLVLSGWPGIGKTTLWEAGVEEARRDGARILSARPSDAEARLVFGASIDVLDPVGSDEWSASPRHSSRRSRSRFSAGCRPAIRLRRARSPSVF